MQESRVFFFSNNIRIKNDMHILCKVLSSINIIYRNGKETVRIAYSRCILLVTMTKRYSVVGIWHTVFSIRNNYFWYIEAFKAFSIFIYISILRISIILFIEK